MTPEQVETEILKIVCSRFMRLKESTPRKRLVVKFRNPEVISGLAARGMMRSVGSHGDESYLPTSAAFASCGDDDLVGFAKSGFSIALHAMKNLFEVEPEKADFTYEDLLNHARKMYDVVDEDLLRLGLYLSQDFRLLNSWGAQADGITITNFRISENIVKIERPENQWDEQSKKRDHQTLPYAAPAHHQHQHDVQAQSDIKGIGAHFDWNLIHPEIVRIAKSRFETNHFADAVEAALKGVNERVRQIFVGARGEERDGASLMNEAFSPKSPVLVLGDLSTMSGRDMQLGYMQIFSGSMTGIRNPKAHGNVDIDATRAAHFLFLASLLMYKIDEARIETSIPEPAVQRQIAAPKRRAEPLSLKPRLEFERASVPGGGDWQRYLLKVKIENDGDEAATDYRLDVYFPANFIDGGGHVAMVGQCDKPGYTLFRVRQSVERIYPGDKTGWLLTFHYAMPGKTVRENPEAFDVHVIATVFSGNMKPQTLTVPLSQLMMRDSC